MTEYVRGAIEGRYDPVVARRGLRVLAIAVSVAGVLVGQQYETVLSVYGLLFVATVGGIIGVHSWSRDGYRLYGNVIIGTTTGLLLAWVVLGVLPTLYIDVSVFDAMFVTVYTSALTAYPVLLAFFSGLFGGTLVLAVGNTVGRARGIMLSVLGLVAYTGAHLMLLQVMPYHGEDAISPSFGSRGEIRAYELLKFFGGLVAFYGLISWGGDLPFDRALVACALVCAAFGGAGIASADAQFTGAMDVTAVQSGVSTDVESVSVADEQLSLTTTVHNPTDSSFVVTAGFLRVYSGSAQLAYGPLTVENPDGRVRVPAGGSATIEYSLRLSPRSAETTQTALESGDLRLVGRHAIDLNGRSGAIRFSAWVG